MNEVLKKIGEVGIVPVVKLDTPDQAVPLGRALMEGGSEKIYGFCLFYD